MGDPSGAHHQDAATSSLYGAHASGNGGGCSVPESMGFSSEWSAEEQAILEDSLLKYASESSINLYAKIAIHLPNKTIRDVVLRCRWLSSKDNSKRRKEENIARKNKDKKERVINSSGRSLPYSSQLNVSSNSNSLFPTNYRDGILDQVKVEIFEKLHPWGLRGGKAHDANSEGSDVLLQNLISGRNSAMGGVTVKLLEQNAHAFSQISSNLSTMQTQENINLLRQTRDNILRIVHGLNDVSEIMRRMPPLPVTLNEELASTIIPLSNLPRSISN